MTANPIRSSSGGPFATSRRGSMTQEDVAKAFDLRAAGRGNQAIAAYFGRSMEDISRLFRSAPVSPSPEVEAKSGAEKASRSDEFFQKMWHEGVSLPEMARALGVTRSGIETKRVRLGLPPRKAWTTAQYLSRQKLPPA